MNFLPENSVKNSTKPAGIPMNQNIGVNSRKFSNSESESNIFDTSFMREDYSNFNLGHAVYPSPSYFEKRHSIDIGGRKDYNPIPNAPDITFTEALYAAPGGPIASTRSVSPTEKMGDLWNPLNYTDISATVSQYF